MKRKRNPNLFTFSSFGEPGSPFTPSSTFRENVRLFLQECGEHDESTFLGNPLWCTKLVDNDANIVVPLYTIEKDVMQAKNPFCEYCRSFGWSEEFVTWRTYHFIIPMDSELHNDALVNKSHLLHGVIHCNGCGHLVCINGCEEGSNVLSGRKIMDLWDRICTNLKARRVSVEDVSRKRSMDLRLLHGVAYGHSWFGKWDYGFCLGSSGVTEIDYDEAIAYLGSLSIDEIARDLSNTKCHTEVEQMIRCYIDKSETQIKTIRDLLSFMLTVQPCAPVSKTNNVPSPAFNSRNPKRQRISNRTDIMKDKSPTQFKTIVANDRKWPKSKLEEAAQVIVGALNEHKGVESGSGVMTRQDLRDAARLHIGATGLLDHVLKLMENVIVQNYVVRRKTNPETKLLEYTIHEHGNVIKELKMEPEVMAHLDPKEESSRMPVNDVNSDVLYVYKNVLLGYPDSEKVKLAVQRILDSRHFVKNFGIVDGMEQVLTFICKLKPTVVGNICEFREPGCDVIVKVPFNATVGHLKKAAEDALRDTYCMAENVTVEDVDELMGVSDEQLLSTRQILSGEELCLRWSDINLRHPFKCQGGPHKRKVRCVCGAQEDNWERMVACDTCGVWEHTKCQDIDDLPQLFMCDGCWGRNAPESFEPSP